MPSFSKLFRDVRDRMFGGSTRPTRTFEGSVTNSRRSVTRSRGIDARKDHREDAKCLIN